MGDARPFVFDSHEYLRSWSSVAIHQGSGDM